jgi:dTMP kinase
MLIANNKPISTTISDRRGAFIVLEGVDRCGKTTQSALLLKKLISLGIAAVAMRFPDRTTPVGQLINSYLTSGSELDDHAVHLLFSANRWEAAPKLTDTLKQGTTIVCDRYAHSGVAFSSAKVNDHNEAIMSIDWCLSSDKGLPAPDAVIFLDLSLEEAERRGGYERGQERFGTVLWCNMHWHSSQTLAFNFTFYWQVRR